VAALLRILVAQIIIVPQAAATQATVAAPVVFLTHGAEVAAQVATQVEDQITENTQ
jgi:hypothetical protein